MGPVGQHLQHPALDEVRRTVPHDIVDQAVCRAVSLPIGQSLNVWRGGDITYGGLVTIKSNFSPATGAKRSPCRRSSLMELILAVSRASWIARGLRSVATTVRRAGQMGSAHHSPYRDQEPAPPVGGW